MVGLIRVVLAVPLAGVLFQRPQFFAHSGRKCGLVQVKRSRTHCSSSSSSSSSSRGISYTKPPLARLRGGISGSQVPAGEPGTPPKALTESEIMAIKMQYTMANTTRNLCGVYCVKLGRSMRLMKSLDPIARVQDHQRNLMTVEEVGKMSVGGLIRFLEPHYDKLERHRKNIIDSMEALQSVLGDAVDFNDAGIQDLPKRAKGTLHHSVDSDVDDDDEEEDKENEHNDRLGGGTHGWMRNETLSALYDFNAIKHHLISIFTMNWFDPPPLKGNKTLYGERIGHQLDWKMELVAMKNVKERLRTLMQHTRRGDDIPRLTLRFECLESVLKALYRIELADDFKSKLESSWEMVGKRLGIEQGAFAYLHTSFLKFTQVFEHTDVEPLISYYQKYRKNACVLGCNIGWTAFFISIGYGIPTQAYDLNLFLLQGARRIYYTEVKGRALDAQLSFCVNDDPSMVRLSKIHILYIDHLPWQLEMRARVYIRATCDLPMGAIVVDRGDFLGQEFFDQHFQILASVAWTEDEKINVFRKHKECTLPPKMLYDSVMERLTQV